MKSENCFHYSDMQAELEQIKAQIKITQEKHVSDKKFINYKAHSLTEQLRGVNNRYAHIEEAPESLCYMMKKRNTPNTSTNHAIKTNFDKNLMTPDNSCKQQNQRG